MRTRPRPLTSRPTVSVVVPCHNYAHFLPGCLDSVLGQHDVDLEVIVVDDCSTDDSLAVAQEYAARDPRVLVVHHPVNQGHIRTYNDGLGRASGTYVVLLSADDLLCEGSLGRSVALLEAHPEVGLVYGYPLTFGEELDAPEHSGRTGWSVWPGETWLGGVCRRGRNPIVNPEVVMRRSVLEASGVADGPYDAAHPHAADLKLWLHAASRAAVGRVNGPVQAGYREHGGNMHRTQYDGVLTDLRETRKVFDAFFAEDGDLLTRPRELSARVGSALAREALAVAGVVQAGGESGDGASTGVAADGASAQALAEFAADCDPSVRGSRAWRAYERREAHGVGALERRVLRTSFSLRWRVRWRRWRRFGT